ncbi:hypothetical protein PGT21_030831 [Puccinia graminis f. sp. tritici]|uniref:Uncharacterized protein n=1 Tax=Puccinia graminis f. sp. tritici TaxID=56615 RepID=A0A5B0Q7D0_PUCGR|nr:hypothetical protein PGT21_030831 [Puccinia graminis f. sp. tritici]
MAREMWVSFYKPRSPTPTSSAPTTASKPKTSVLAGLGNAAAARGGTSSTGAFDIWLAGSLILEGTDPIFSIQTLLFSRSSNSNHRHRTQFLLSSHQIQPLTLLIRTYDKGSFSAPSPQPTATGQHRWSSTFGPPSRDQTSDLKIYSLIQLGARVDLSKDQEFLPFLGVYTWASLSQGIVIGQPSDAAEKVGETIRSFQSSQKSAKKVWWLKSYSSSKTDLNSQFLAGCRFFLTVSIFEALIFVGRRRIESWRDELQLSNEPKINPITPLLQELSCPKLDISSIEIPILSRFKDATRVIFIPTFKAL